MFFYRVEGIGNRRAIPFADFSLTKVKKTNIMKKNQIVKESLIK